MTFLLTTWGFFLMGVWPQTNLWYLVMVIGCLFISSPLSSAREMINVPTFPTVASVYKMLSLKDIQCFKMLIRLIFFLPGCLGEDTNNNPWDLPSNLCLREQIEMRTQGTVAGAFRGRFLGLVEGKTEQCDSNCMSDVWRLHAKIK